MADGVDNEGTTNPLSSRPKNKEVHTIQRFQNRQGPQEAEKQVVAVHAPVALYSFEISDLVQWRFSRNKDKL